MRLIERECDEKLPHREREERKRVMGHGHIESDEKLTENG